MAKRVQKPPLPPPICHIFTRRRVAEVYCDFAFAHDDFVGDDLDDFLEYPKDGIDRSAAERQFHPGLNQPVESSEVVPLAFCFWPRFPDPPRSFPRGRLGSDALSAVYASGHRLPLRFGLRNPGQSPVPPPFPGTRRGSAARARPARFDRSSTFHRPPPFRWAPAAACRSGTSSCHRPDIGAGARARASPAPDFSNPAGPGCVPT